MTQNGCFTVIIHFKMHSTIRPGSPMNVDDITESQLGTGHEWSKKSETTTTAAAALAAIDLGLLEEWI
jgi:hypothetical protein